MQTSRRDPLLSIARVMLVISMAVTLLVSVACLLASPMVYLFRDKVIDSLTSAGAPPESVWAVITVLGLIAVASALGFLFFRHLARIVATVGEGDPFVPVNADRLQAMGWISVVVQVLAIPTAGIGGWLEHVTGISHRGVNISLAGLLLAVVLFVLARVFRQGARMREDLEGTV